MAAEVDVAAGSSGPKPPRPALLATRGLCRTFAGIAALSDVDFEVRAGEVHALVGANGAGKSTLIKLLAGVHRPSGGEIRIDGRTVNFDSPRQSQQAGIATVYQELSLVPQLTVAENLFLGREPLQGGWRIDHATRRRQAAALLQQHGFLIDPDRVVGQLGVADQQLVEIARALSFESRLLILDEPTAVLSVPEQHKLFDIIGALRTRGIAVLYISHRLEEIFTLADRVSVFRDGRHRATLQIRETRESEIVRLMVGELDTVAAADPGQRSFAPLLEAHWTHRDRSHRLAVGRGEIVGVAGFVGSGRSRVARRIAGMGPDPMRVTLEDRPIAGHGVARTTREGVVYVTEDRKRDGLFAPLRVLPNVTASALRRVTTLGLMRFSLERALSAPPLARLRLKADSTQLPVSALSGGNQQKVIFARALLQQPRVLICDEPTRGVDVGAKQEIYGLLRELAADGVGILVVSSEFAELRALCDRIVVMMDGCLVADLPATVAEDHLLMAASGINTATIPNRTPGLPTASR